MDYLMKSVIVMAEGKRSPHATAVDVIDSLIFTYEWHT